MKINSITKLYILSMLDSGDLHGYELIKEIEKRTGTKLSASHIYPFLKELKENNFVGVKNVVEGHEKNLFSFTKSGRKFYRDFMKKFSVMLESGIKKSLVECHHCHCLIYQNHYYSVVDGKRMAFCCDHCAAAFLKGDHCH